MNNKIRALAFAGAAFICAACSHAAATNAQPQQLAASSAESVTAMPQLAERAADLVRMINGEITPGQLFTPEVLAQMPAERFNALAGQLRSRRGRAMGVNRVEASSPRIGVVYIDFERSQIPLRIQITAEAPHLVSGLQTVTPQ
jgi:hypothetical protein